MSYVHAINRIIGWVKNFGFTSFFKVRGITNALLFQRFAVVAAWGNWLKFWKQNDIHELQSKTKIKLLKCPKLMFDLITNSISRNLKKKNLVICKFVFISFKIMQIGTYIEALYSNTDL